VKVPVEGVDPPRIEKLHAGEFYSAMPRLLPGAESYEKGAGRAGALGHSRSSST